MPAPVVVAVLVGSLRKESWTRKVAMTLAEVAPARLSLNPVDLSKLAIYNQDLDADPPGEWAALRERIKRAGAALFVTPEYNRSVPAVLKNAIDIASRPYGQNAWDRTPGAVVSVTPNTMGAFGSNHHLRQALVFLNVPTMAQPEASISRVDTLFDASGAMTNAGTRKFLAGFMAAFDAWVDANPKPPRPEAALG
jgi:chromate reductase, NAD(P)H dehydrogenase (quinone)